MRQALLDRFLRYVKQDTQADDTSTTIPSTPGQTVLQEMLKAELEQMGLETDLHNGILYGHKAGTGAPIGFLAHVDTALEASGKNVNPQINGNIITTDGTTLLGGDDKAGVAIIMTALDRHKESDRPVYVAFTSDEEIGTGMDRFDLSRFPVKEAYTVDGASPEYVDTDTFNAAQCKVTVTGVEIHPGEAYGVMVNAGRIAAQIADALPQTQAPETTKDREGYFHLSSISGAVDTASLEIIIRDHDREKFSARKAWLDLLLSAFALEYPGHIVWEISDQYKNMAEYGSVDKGKLDAVFARQGLVPVYQSVRGGTDGSRLSEMGIYTPNLGTGSHNHHSRKEYADLDEMETLVRIVSDLMKGEADGHQ